MTTTGKTILITGGGSGIGFAIANKFSQAGASVIIADIHKEQGESAAKSLKNTHFIQADVSKKDEIVAMVEEAIHRVGKIDVLVNNAGIARHAKSLELSEENWQFSLNLMLSGVFYCSQAIGKHMVAHGGGNIINITSINSTIYIPGRLAYSCSKAAVLTMTKILAAEWAPYHIRVNAVSPGVTFTKLMEDAIESGMANETSYLSRIPLGRFAKPEEIADACFFISSDQAGYVTGNNLIVDGGWSSYNWIDIEHAE